MKHVSSTLTVFILISIFMSCSKDEVVKNQGQTDCFFEQIDENMDGLIDETEKMIMNECMENSFSSKSNIESNLVGEWRLIGHGEGWVPTNSQPCGYITITSDELIFEFRNNDIDKVITSGWEIEEVNSGMNHFFKLNVDSEYLEGLFITNFCENYMFGDSTPSDGNMYLYEKINTKGQ